MPTKAIKASNSAASPGQTVPAKFDPLRGPLAAKVSVLLPRRHRAHQRMDDYAWLRDDDPHQKRPEILAQLNAENAWTEAQTAHLLPLREALDTELRARIRDDDRSVPCYRRNWWYESRYTPGAEHPQHVRRRGTPDGPQPGAAEQLLLDEEVEAAGRQAYALGDIAVSPDDRLLAWTEDVTGRRHHRLRVRDLQTGQMMDESVEGVLEGFQWAADSRTIFYVRQDPQRLQSGPVCRHTLGSPVEADVQVFHEDDEAMFVSLSGTSSRRYILICIEGDDSSEIRAVPSDTPHADPLLVIPRRFGVRHEVDHLKDLWVLLTNEHARGFRLVQAPAEAPADRRRWTDVVPHRRGVVIEDFVLFDRAIVVQERMETDTRLRVLPWSADGRKTTACHEAPDIQAAQTQAAQAQAAQAMAGRPTLAAISENTILSDEATGVLVIDDNPDPSANHLRYAITSLITPLTIVDVNLASGVRTQRHVAPVQGYQREHYDAARLWAPARDGRQVPVSIAWRRASDQPTRVAAPPRRPELSPRRWRARQATRPGQCGAPTVGPRAVLLTAYGAYGDPFEPSFDAEWVSLMDRGFAVAIAHVRGGNELGDDWYDQGRLAAKMNSFFDFIDVTRFLVRKGWAPRDRVFAEGGSAGGLLMAAVANMAGELYRGMLLQVPFVDVLTTMLDENLPLTTQERCEWGDPRQQTDFEAIKAWSPYDNLRAKAYPAMFVTAALHDAQVPVHEPAKYVARLRELKTDRAPLLLQVEMLAGHTGRAGRFARLTQRALEFAFLLDLAKHDAAQNPN